MTAESFEDALRRWPETEHLAARVAGATFAFEDAAGHLRDDGIPVGDVLSVLEEFTRIAFTLRPARPDMIAAAARIAAVLPQIRAFHEARDRAAFVEAQGGTRQQRRAQERRDRRGPHVPRAVASGVLRAPPAYDGGKLVDLADLAVPVVEDLIARGHAPESIVAHAVRAGGHLFAAAHTIEEARSLVAEGHPARPFIEPALRAEPAAGATWCVAFDEGQGALVLLLREGKSGA